MNKKEFKKEKKAYVRPVIEVVNVNADLQLLAGSPPVEPGGGGVDVEPPKDDDEDTDLTFS